MRLMFEAPLDLLGVYQHSWNPAKASLAGHKVSALLKQRQKVWRLVEQWLRTVPRRHGCLIVGDLNTPAVSEPGVCGPAVVQQQIQQQDQAEFQDILRKHQCCILNSWSGTGNNMRTYIPPGDVDGQRGTQIDFVIARDALADDISKTTGPFQAPF